MLIVCFILIAIFAGWWFGTIEISSGFSRVVAVSSVNKNILGIGVVLFIIIGGCLFGHLLTKDIVLAATLTTPASSVIIALGGSLAVLTTYKLLTYSSIAYGIFGAIIGWKFFSSGSMDYVYTLRLLITWLIVPVLSASISAILYYSYRFFILRSGSHIFTLLHFLRICLIWAVIAFALAVGMNNGALIMALNNTIPLEFDLSVYQFDINKQHILFILSVVIITLVTWPKTIFRMKKMVRDEFEINIESSVIALISSALILIFFSIPSLCSVIGLQSTPLSISCVILGASVGVCLVKKLEWVDYTSIVKAAGSILITPLTAFIFTYIILRIVNPNSILTDENTTEVTSRNIINITPVIITILILIFLYVIFIYIKKQKRIREQVENNLTLNQKELFENQKAMSELEIKTVVTENEYLNNKLELKRKELISIALNISEQKKILEDLYTEIKSIKEIDNFEEQKAQIDKIEKRLLHKMNFSQEVESFYAQIESLHKDFSLRLTEKYPNLTGQEKRLITLLRLGFSSKHIASLMNIATKSVEISRYRLRTKLDLNRKDNLIQFIKSI